MYITSLKIQNLRCFEEAELTFQYPERDQADSPKMPNVNLLLGDNGAGKTTILKAIALSTLAPIIPHSSFVPYRLVRREKDHSISPTHAEVTAQVIMHEQDTGNPKPYPNNLRARIEQKNEEEYMEFIDSKLPIQPSDLRWRNNYFGQSSAFLVVGYGASRQVEDPEKVDPYARRKFRVRYERVSGLFESYVSLIPLASWLPNFRKENSSHHNQVVNLINRLLPEGASFAGEFEQGEYLFEINGTKAPFGALSDGYRAYIRWIADLLYHICMGAPKGAKLVDNRGIVLVDEIDLHLHPEWQRSVIKTISETLPNLQFVFTTHSPIVAGSLQKENIFVMETTADGASVVKQYDEEIYGRTAEQVLLSSYFNLDTTRAEPFEDELKALSIKAGKGDLQAALTFMKKLSAPTNGTNTKAKKSNRKTAKPR